MICCHYAEFILSAITSQRKKIINANSAAWKGLISAPTNSWKIHAQQVIHVTFHTSPMLIRPKWPALAHNKTRTAETAMEMAYFTFVNPSDETSSLLNGHMGRYFFVRRFYSIIFHSAIHKWHVIMFGKHHAEGVVMKKLLGRIKWNYHGETTWLNSKKPPLVAFDEMIEARMKAWVTLTVNAKDGVVTRARAKVLGIFSWNFR